MALLKYLVSVLASIEKQVLLLYLLCKKVISCIPNKNSFPLNAFVHSE